MKRQLSAWALSLCLAFTAAFSTATPARADEDVLKVLLGVGALVALGTVINKQKQKREAEQAQAARAQTERFFITRPGKRKKVKIAPQNCLRNQWTHRGNRQVYGARCMQRQAQHKLPQRCLRRAEVREGPRQFYSPQCLRQRGWRA